LEEHGVFVDVSAGNGVFAQGVHLTGITGQVVVDEVDNVNTAVQQEVFNIGASANVKVVASQHFHADGFVLCTAHTLIELLSGQYTGGTVQDRQRGTVGVAGDNGDSVFVGGVVHLL